MMHIVNGHLMSITFDDEPALRAAKGLIGLQIEGNGGVRIDDPGVDLAIVAALASSYLDKALPRRTLVLGEVGLTGEVRPVAQVRARLREAARLGFTRAIVGGEASDKTGGLGLEVKMVSSVAESWEALR